MAKKAQLFHAFCKYSICFCELDYMNVWLIKKKFLITKAYFI